MDDMAKGMRCRTTSDEGALAHVRWIGGSTCAGKTSIADALAAKYGLQTYHFDRHEMDHFRRRIADGDSDAAAFLAMTMDERWLGSTPQDMARTTVESWSSRVPLVIEDLRAMPRGSGIIAEGPGFFPECIEPWVEDRRQAIWLVSTRSFCEAVRRRRPGSALQTSYPERALANIVERDVLMGAHVRREAERRAYRVVEVDASRGLEEVAAEVDRWLFGA